MAARTEGASGVLEAYALRVAHGAAHTRMSMGLAYSQQLRAYRLAHADDPPAGRYLDAYPTAWHAFADL